MNKWFSILSLILIAFVFQYCTINHEPLQAVKDGNTSFKFNLNFPKHTHTVLGPTTSGMNVNSVTVRISGEGMNKPIVKKLDINRTQNTAEARGKFTLPLGNKDIDVSAAVVQGNLIFELFTGYKNINVQPDMKPVIIQMQEQRDDEDMIAYHNNVFSDYINGAPGAIYALGIDLSTFGAIYLKSIAFRLNWQGNADQYRVFIDDDTDPSTPRFLSAPLDPPTNNTTAQWVILDLIWEPPVQGVFNGLLIAGIAFEGNFPLIGYDTSDPSQNSLYYDPNDQQWYYMSDGDFGITLIVQLPTQQPVAKSSLSLKHAPKPIELSQSLTWKSLQRRAGQ